MLVAGSLNSYLQLVSDIEYKVRQRWWLVLASAGGFTLALGSALIIALSVQFARTDVTLMLGALGLVVGPTCLNLALGRTVLTKTGFTTRGVFGERSCQWNQIDRVETKTYHGRGGSSTWIVVHPTAGKPIRLRAPFATTSVPGPDFLDALSKIKSRTRVPRSR